MKHHIPKNKNPKFIDTENGTILHENGKILEIKLNPYSVHLIKEVIYRKGQSKDDPVYCEDPESVVKILRYHGYKNKDLQKLFKYKNSNDILVMKLKGIETDFDDFIYPAADFQFYQKS